MPFFLFYVWPPETKVISSPSATCRPILTIACGFLPKTGWRCPRHCQSSDGGGPQFHYRLQARSSFTPIPQQYLFCCLQIVMDFLSSCLPFNKHPNPKRVHASVRQCDPLYDGWMRWEYPVECYLFYTQMQTLIVRGSSRQRERSQDRVDLFARGISFPRPLFMQDAATCVQNPLQCVRLRM